MTKNLIGIIITLLFALVAFLSNSNVIKIIMASIAGIIFVLIILWIIGYTSMKKKENKHKKQ